VGLDLHCTILPFFEERMKEHSHVASAIITLTKVQPNVECPARDRPDLLNLAASAAFKEILKQVPEAVDCSAAKDLTEVLVPDGVNIKLVVASILKIVTRSAS
jgi:hypothetical protein